MSIDLISEYVNLDIYPEITKVKDEALLTLGDLHGNALKLLYFLIKHEIVTCEKRFYERFVIIYRKHPNDLSKEDLLEIKAICQQLIVKNKTKICLIGDVLADRGQNDYFTLLLLYKLHNESVPIDILLSNHDFTFIECLEVYGIFRSSRPCGDREFASSMQQMQDLIETYKLDFSEIKTMVENAYLPKLKLLSYSLDNENEITRFSHARIDDKVMINLAIVMNVPFLALTVAELAQTIDAINYSFQKNYVEKKLIHALVKESFIDDKNDPINFLMWNRSYYFLLKILPFKINEVYGHDSAGPQGENIYCLDNLLGKSLDEHCGVYNVVVSSFHELSNEQRIRNSINRYLKEKENDFINACFKTVPPAMYHFTNLTLFGGTSPPTKYEDLISIENNTY